MGRLHTLAMLLLVCSVVNGQQQIPRTNWSYIDSCISTRFNLDSIDRLLVNTQSAAISARRGFIAARAALSRMLIRDLRTEDTLFFRNSSFMDSALMGNNKDPEWELAMHLLLAKRLYAFYHSYRKFNLAKYKQGGLPVDYGSLSISQMDSTITSHFLAARKLAIRMGANNVEDALWLAPDPMTFLFRPKLIDIVLTSEIVNIPSGSVSIPQTARSLVAQLQLTPDDFISRLDSLANQAANLRSLGLYKEWLSYHRDDPAAYYYIETLARQFLNTSISYVHDSDQNKIYEDYLIKISRSSYSMVRARGIFQLCLLWQKQSMQYHPLSPYFNYDYNYRSKFDTAFRYHARKALDLFDHNRSMFDSFTYLKNVLELMRDQILSSDLKLTTRKYAVPGEKILSLLQFKNLDTVYYFLVKGRLPMSILIDQGQSYRMLLDRAVIVRKGIVALKDSEDHNYHSAFVALDSLPSGQYVMLFSDMEGMGTRMSHADIEVSPISILKTGTRIFALDRSTGRPLHGASLKASFPDLKDKYGRLIPRDPLFFTTNAQGYVDVTDEDVSLIDATYGDYTFRQSVDIKKPEELSEDVYDQSEGDIIEFYEDKAEVHIYTDRSIYRPGQTVHYKAIFVTRNKNTGAYMVMNKQNMGGTLFKSVFKHWLKEEEPQLFIKDAFNKEIDTITIRPNSFGSVSGSFVIPKTAATGDWSISTDNLEDRGGEFKVEEYKRPTYEMTIDPSRKNLLPGDSFYFRVKLRSFAGAPLNNVKVSYSLERTREIRTYDSISKSWINPRETLTLLDTIGFTNADGDLLLPIQDSMPTNMSRGRFLEWTNRYSIDAEAIDATGESVSADAKASVYSKPMRIMLPSKMHYEQHEKNRVSIFTRHQDGGPLSGKINLKLIAINRQSRPTSHDLMDNASVDIWLYDKTAFNQWFPEFIVEEQHAEEKKIVLDTIIDSRGGGYFDLDRFTPGLYRIETEYFADGRIQGDAQKEFTIFDGSGSERYAGTEDFHFLPINSFKPGDSLHYYFGNKNELTYQIFQIQYLTGNGKVRRTEVFDFRSAGSGVHKWSWKIPRDAIHEALLTQSYIINGELFFNEETIYVTGKSQQVPEIVVEKYRRKLTPGSRETFVVSIKTNNQNTAMELMTTMYDASLDKIEKHNWYLPNNRRSDRLRQDWTSSINNSVTNEPYRYFNKSTSRIDSNKNIIPVWWMGEQDDYSLMGNWNNRSNSARRFNLQDGNLDNVLVGKVSGLQVTTDQLNEVVVVGYGSVKKRELTGSVVTVRGVASITDYAQPLIILDGVVYEGKLDRIDTKTITNALVFKGEDAVTLYGARAAKGVLVLSTKGEIVLPVPEEEPPIPVRKNFNESAFFFPQVHAGRDSYYSFTFTLPESVTEWNWKMLAHSKNAAFTLLEKKLVSQLPLMIQPNMPRVLYQGDRIVLQSRITNLDTVVNNGTVSCRIEDAATGQDLTGSMVATTKQPFSVNRSSQSSSSFEIRIPPAQMNPIRVIISARSANFSDGEEHIIPVLSPMIFVRQASSFSFQGNDTILKPSQFPPDAKLYGVGLSVSPKPQSALINALPFLANYSFDCAEQLTNKIVANLIALKIMRSDSLARTSFDAAKKNEGLSSTSTAELPDELTSDAMPWLKLDNLHARQQHLLFHLLDTSKTTGAIGMHLEKLLKLQNADKGLTWFPGGQSNRYISQYVLGVFGRLNEDGLLLSRSHFNPKFFTFINALARYCDDAFFNPIDQTSTQDWIDYIYSRSYWRNLDTFSTTRMNDIRTRLEKAWKDVSGYNLRRQAQLITVTIRLLSPADDLSRRAITQLNSIRQLAIVDERNGLRWKDLSDADDLNISAEESIAFLAEAYAAAGKDDAVGTGIIRWLMTTRSEYQWKTTKATSSVVMLLSRYSSNITGSTTAIDGQIGNEKIGVSNDLLNGKAFDFRPVSTPDPALRLTSKGGHPSAGFLHTYYFTANPNTGSNADPSITKQLFIWNTDSKSWKLIVDSTTIRLGDRIMVRLLIKTTKALRFVYLDDKRAAGFEPVDNNSGYEWNGGLGYYQSVRDASMQFFVDFIPSGEHQIEYECMVSQEGSFSNGPASLECMYRPEVAAYSKSMKIEVVK